VAKRPAKSRKGARKTARAKRPASRRRAAASRVSLQPRKNLPLKQLRAELDRAIQRLNRRADLPDEASAKVSQAISVFTRWTEDIDSICSGSAALAFCGPSMDPFAIQR
jgi:hypothetical protein